MVKNCLCQSEPIISGRGAHLLECTDTNVKNQELQKKQVNITQQKETNKTSITDPREMKIYGLSDKEFRIIFLNISELQEHTDNSMKMGKQ